MSFLGDQTEHAVEAAHEVLLTVSVPAFDLQLTGVACLGNRSPRLVYAEVKRNPELIDLERKLSRMLRRAGLEFEKRRFRPHVTLARLPKSLSSFELSRVHNFLTDNAGFRAS